MTQAGILIEAAGGATATALIGRFTIWSDEMKSLARKIAAREAANNPMVVFADIGQQSEPHVDNINRRSQIYAYEIPVNSISNYPQVHQLALSDLWISVLDGQLVLTSGSLNKIVIPRLASAYNYTRNQLDLFQLLGDLQYQGIQGDYTFELERFFPGMRYYPRVVYDDCILSPATWHLDAPAALKTKESYCSMQIKLGLPDHIVLCEADQQLVFDTSKDSELELLLVSLQRLDRVLVREYLPPAPLISDNSDVLVNQFIAFAVNSDTVYGDNYLPTIAKQKAQATYLPGSEWLYLKIYCSSAMTNALLVRKIWPLLTAESKVIDSWFFIRYEDPGHHIRLRLRLNPADTGKILSRFKKALTKSVFYQLVQDYQAEVYRRELERYGPDLIEQVEAVFAASSSLVVHYLRAVSRRKVNYTYHSLAFVSVRWLVRYWLPAEDERLIFLGQMVDTFSTEFGKGKKLKIDLDWKYRQLKAEIENLDNFAAYYRTLKLEAYNMEFVRQNKVLADRASTFDTGRRRQLLADLIHMHLNRIFPERQRLQELVVYHSIYKYKLGLRSRTSAGT